LIGTSQFFIEVEALTITIYPINKHLSDYEMIPMEFPFYVSLNEIRKSFPAHRHDFIECSLVIEGEGFETINGKPHAISRGTFTWLLPYQVHEIVTTSPTPLRLYNCMFEMEMLALSSMKEARHLQLLQKELEQPFVQLEGERLTHVEMLLSSLLQEYEQDRPFRKELMLLKMHEVLIQFQREHCAGGELTGPGAARMERESAAWPIIEYIHSHYRDEISLADLSDIFGIHPSRISVEIKKHAGINFLNLLHEIRLRHACSLLAATDMSILEIAVEVGFSTYKSFARVFRDVKGITPSDYRRQQSDGRSSPGRIRFATR